MLIHLAVANVWRRLSRSTLTLLAMGVAAAVLTSGLSLSQGIMRSAYFEYRAYFGGDILVFSPGFIGAAPVDQTSEEAIVKRLLQDSGFNPLLTLYPGYQTDGYLAQEPWEYAPLSLDWLNPNIPAGVIEATPYRVMPAELNGADIELKRSPVDIRPYIVEGREPTISVTSEIRAVISAYGAPHVTVGDVVQISVPRFKLDQRGVPYADYGEPPTQLAVRIVGKVAWPTRTLTWGTDGAVFSETAYVHKPEVYLTESSWQQIWSTQSGGADYPVLSVALKVANLSKLNVVAAAIQDQYPELAVFAMPRVAQHLERYNLIDKFYQAPTVVWQGTETIQPYAPREFGMLSSILLYLNAGMLLASQMLASVAARRKEIGILKAIGARQTEVVGMILVEAIVLAMMGALAGFGLIRLAGLHQSLSNGIRLTTILNTTVREFITVASLTTVVSIVFGAIPAWRVARLTVMEVFRSE